MSAFGTMTDLPRFELRPKLERLPLDSWFQSRRRAGRGMPTASLGPSPASLRSVRKIA